MEVMVVSVVEADVLMAEEEAITEVVLFQQMPIIIHYQQLPAHITMAQDNQILPV